MDNFDCESVVFFINSLAISEIIFTDYMDLITMVGYSYMCAHARTQVLSDTYIQA